MRSRFAATIVALAIVPLGATTMTGASQAAPATTTTSTAATGLLASLAPSTAKPLKIVLLGDSYSAGNGARTATDERDYYGPSGCYRSHSNWASKYVDLLEKDGYNVTFDNRACSGGVTAGMVNPRNMGTSTRQTIIPGTTSVDEATAYLTATDPCNTRSYIDEEYWTYKALAPNLVATTWTYSCTRWLRAQTEFVGADTDLVLFTIGGNDIKFESIVMQCFVPGPRSPGDCRAAVEGATKNDLPTVRTGILGAIERMRTNGLREDAKVVVPGYPLLAMDDDFTLKQWFGLGKDSYAVSQGVRTLGMLGNTEQSSAIEAANAGHPGQVVHIGDIPTVFAGHEPNASATSRNPNRWLFEFETTVKEEYYHPNSIGHTAYANHLYSKGTFGATVDTKLGGNLDIVFAVDTTGSMAADIDAAKQYARDLVAYVSANSTSARFAVVSYRDHPEHTGDPIDYPARVDQGFTYSAPDIEAALSTLEANGGGDGPESMWSGIKAGIDLPWRAGVKKLVIVLADAPAHNPEPVSGLTASDIIAAAAAVDPAVIYAVDTSSADSNGALTEVTEQTGGSIINASSSADVPAALRAITADAIIRPHAWINGPYVAPVGREISLDASGSYATVGSLVSYAWDFTSDGTIDQTTTSSQVTYAWTEPFLGLATVTVTDDSGRTAVANTHIGITTDGDEIPAEEDNCPAVANMGQEDYDQDGVGDACDATPGYGTDKPGVTEGRIGDEPTSVTSPKVTGKAHAGQRLKTTTGTWTGSPTLTYQWTRNGKSIAGATKASYLLTRADIGKKVAPQVLAREPQAPAQSVPTVATGPSRTVGKFLATVKVRAGGNSLSVKVRSEGQKSKRVRGVLRAYEGKKLVGKVKITAKNWRRAKMQLRNLDRGKNKLVVKYSGNKVTASAKSRTVTIRVV